MSRDTKTSNRMNDSHDDDGDDDQLEVIKLSLPLLSLLNQ